MKSFVTLNVLLFGYMCWGMQVPLNDKYINKDG